MALKLASLKTDPKRQETAEWEIAPGLPGVRFLVRAASIPSWRLKNDQITKKHQRKYGESVPVEADAADWGVAIHEELLRGWDGLDEAYSPELALAVLTDPQHQALRLQVLACAHKRAIPDVEFAESAAKNSEAPSATT